MIMKKESQTKSSRIISLLIVAVLLLCTFKSDEMIQNNKNVDNCVNYIFYYNCSSKILSSVAIKIDNMKDLSLKKTDSGRVRPNCRRGIFEGFNSLINPVLLSFVCVLLFYLCRALRCDRLFIISYIHSLDGTKP